MTIDETKLLKFTLGPYDPINKWDLEQERMKNEMKSPDEIMYDMENLLKRLLQDSQHTHTCEFKGCTCGAVARMRETRLEVNKYLRIT